jgi:ribosomal protein S27AE
MKNRNCLSTRTDRYCPQCGEEFLLAEPTDVLASRPIQVDLTCPRCHFPGRATLTSGNRFQSVHPSPRAYSLLESVRPHPSPWLLS